MCLVGFLKIFPAKIKTGNTTKKKAFYIGSNGLSTSVMTRGGNTVSLNTDIGSRTIFEG